MRPSALNSHFELQRSNYPDKRGWYNSFMIERIVNPESAEVDDTHDEQVLESLRPNSFDAYIGQPLLKENLGMAIAAAKVRAEPVDHVLLYGPPGLGKTTM